jgi:hypothetical protein
MKPDSVTLFFTAVFYFLNVISRQANHEQIGSLSFFSVSFSYRDYGGGRSGICAGQKEYRSPGNGNAGKCCFRRF